MPVAATSRESSDIAHVFTMGSHANNNTKRPRSEDDDLDDCHALPPRFLSIDELKKLSEEVFTLRDEFINLLRTEKDTPKINKLRTSISCFCDAFHKVSVAYAFALGTESTARHFKLCLDTVAEQIKNSSESINDISSAVQKVAVNQDRTYASIARAPAPPNNRKQHNVITLDKGKTLPISTSAQVIVGPADPSSNTFTSSAATKAKILEVVKPAELGLRISRVFHAANKSVIIEGDARNSVILSELPQLRAAGLEVKDRIKYNPRLIVYDVPSDLSCDDICSALHMQNFPDYNCFIGISIWPVKEEEIKFESCKI